MKACLTCLFEDPSEKLATCPNCGEASWASSTSANDKPKAVDLGGVTEATEEKASAPAPAFTSRRGRR